MKIGFIGLGNMAQAMIGGVLRNHLAVPEEIFGSAKTAETESKVHEMFGITVTGDNLETARQAELLILAVKPQFLEKVIGQISDLDLTGKTILSIAAGKSLAWLEEQFCAPLPFVRAMPNTPALVGEGCTGVCYGSRVTPEMKEKTAAVNLKITIHKKEKLRANAVFRHVIKKKMRRTDKNGAIKKSEGEK